MNLSDPQNENADMMRSGNMFRSGDEFRNVKRPGNEEKYEHDYVYFYIQNYLHDMIHHIQRNLPSYNKC